MGTEYKLLKDRVEKLGDILSAVNFDSPVVASHLLVGACVEMSRIGGVLNGLKHPSYLHKLLVLGYSYANPIEKSLARVKQELERCEVLSHEYYHAFSRMREYGRPVYDEGIKERSAYAKCSIDPLLDDDRACWERMALLVENASYGNSPSCVSPLPDLHPYHEYVWEIIDAMNRAIKIIIASAQQIDAFLVKPTAGMIEELLASKFNDARQGWLESRVKRDFDYDRRECLKFVAEGSRESMELELEFLRDRESGLSSDNEYCEIWRALRLNYDNVADEYDLRRAANDLHRMAWADDLEKECNDLYFIAEDALLYSYIFSGIKRLKEELGKNDEPKVKNDIKSADVVDLSKDDVKKDFQNGNRGRKAESLFDNPKTQSEYAELFSGFLTSRKTYAKVDTKKDNYINKAFVALYRICVKNNLVGKSLNGRACYRFLVDDCKYQVCSNEKTYGTFIKQYAEKVISRDNVSKKYIEDISLIETKMENFMKNK